MVLEVIRSDHAADAVHDYNETALAALGVGKSGEKSARVVIGFVDYGFDLLHPTLLDQKGASRFRFVWDQNRNPDAARAFEFDPAALDDWDGAALDRAVAAAVASGSRREFDALYDPHANNGCRHGTVGGAHGTLMASIAAGTPVSGFRGAAPEADLIGVQLALADTDWKEEDLFGSPTWASWRPEDHTLWQGWRSYDDSRQIINAVRYIYFRGRWLGADALVINLSIGAWAGGHDGRSAVECAIADLIDEADAAFVAGLGPRVIVVAGAGNAGVDEGHWHGVVETARSSNFDWIMQRRDPTQNKLEIWYEGDSLDVKLCLPDGHEIEIAPGATREIWSGSTRIGIAEHAPGLRAPLSCVRMLLHPPLFGPELFEPTADTCAFAVRLAAAHSAPVAVNAWIERDDGAAERSWLSPNHAEGTLCCLATIPGAIVVSGYDHHCTVDGDTPAILPSSSLGPAPWGAGPARIPHFAAPAHCIWGARSKSRGFAMTTGTSAAVALTSGAIAQHFGQHGAHAPLPQVDGAWSPRFGNGLFRIDTTERTGVFA